MHNVAILTVVQPFMFKANVTRHNIYSYKRLGTASIYYLLCSKPNKEKRQREDYKNNKKRMSVIIWVKFIEQKENMTPFHPTE